MVKVVKILYIEENVDEKRAANALEKATATLETAENIVCTFTVVQNAFLGLEFCESVSYDMIFINKDVEDFNAGQFLKVCRNASSPVDVILIMNANDHSLTDEDAKSEGFYSILRKEFNTKQLCDVISSVF